MKNSTVDTFLISSSKYFPEEDLPSIREQLLQLDESKLSHLFTAGFKDPQTSIIISVLAGPLGIDRFYIGDTGLGILKLITCGGFGIWTVIDWFLIMNTTKQTNLRKLHSILTLL